MIKGLRPKRCLNSFQRFRFEFCGINQGRQNRARLELPAASFSIAENSRPPVNLEYRSEYLQTFNEGRRNYAGRQN